MTKLELLNSLFNQARRDKDAVKKSCLSTMKGEIENTMKSSSDSADNIIVNYCLKSKKNLLEYKPAGYEVELKILEQFLPKQLSDEELRQEIRLRVESGDKEKTKANFGFFMGICSRELKGHADVNKIKLFLNEFLS